MSKKLSREELEQKAKDFVLKAYKSFSARSGLETKWRRWDALYNLILEEGGKSNYEGVSKLFPPETRRALQTIADFIIDVLFPPTSDWFRIEGIDGDADVKNAAVYKKIADVQNEKIAIRAKVIKAVYRWLKYGFLIVRAPYVYKDKYVIKETKERKDFKQKLKDFFTGNSTPWKQQNVPEKKPVIVYDNIDFQPKSPWNMFWNYNIPWDQQKIIIEKVDNVTASHLKAQKKKGIYNDNVEGVIEAILSKPSTGKVSDETDTNQKFPHSGQITGLSGEFDDGVPKGVLLQADCYFDIDQDGYDELCVITLALTGEKGKDADGTIIRMQINDCELQEMPLLFCPWDELEDQSLGVGVLQIGEKDQKALNDFTNQMMDNISEILNATRVYDKEMIDEGQNMNSWPRKTIKTKGNPNEVIAFIRPPNIVNEALAAVNMAKGNIQNGTRANISLQGLAARYDTTATEYTQQGSAASRGIMCQIKNFEDNILKPWLRFQYSYNLQYLTRETLIGIIGKKAAQAMLRTEDPLEQKQPKDTIIGDFDFKPLGVTQTENKIIRGQQLINFLNIAMKAEQIKPGTVDIAFLIGKIWEVSGDGDNRILLPQITDPQMDANDENVLLSQGGEVHINPNDNDDEHITAHMPLQLIPEFMKNKMNHLKEHLMSKQKKGMAAQASAGIGMGAQQQPAFQPKLPMPGNNGGVPGVVRPPVGMV
jgi:hypothetical protein